MATRIGQINQGISILPIKQAPAPVRKKNNPPKPKAPILKPKKLNPVQKQVRILFKNNISNEQLDAGGKLFKIGTPQEIANTLILAIKQKRTDAFMAIVSVLTPYGGGYRPDPFEPEILLKAFSFLLNNPKVLKGKRLRHALFLIARYIQAKHHYSKRKLIRQLDRAAKKLLKQIRKIQGDKYEVTRKQAKLLRKLRASSKLSFRRRLKRFQRRYARRLKSGKGLPAYFNTLAMLLSTRPANKVKKDRFLKLLKKTMGLKTLPPLIDKKAIIATTRYSNDLSIRRCFIDLIPSVITKDETYQALKNDLLIERTSVRKYAAKALLHFAKDTGNKYAHQITGDILQALLSKNIRYDRKVADVFGKAIKAGMIRFPLHDFIHALGHSDLKVMLRAIKILGWLNSHISKAGDILKKLSQNKNKLISQAAILAYAAKYRNKGIYSSDRKKDHGNNFVYPVLGDPKKHKSILRNINIKKEAPDAMKDPRIKGLFPDGLVKENADRFELWYLYGYYSTALAELKDAYKKTQDSTVAKAIKIYEKRLNAIKPLCRYLPQIVGKTNMRVYGRNVPVKNSASYIRSKSLRFLIGLGIQNGPRKKMTELIWQGDKKRPPVTFRIGKANGGIAHFNYFKFEIILDLKYLSKKKHIALFILHAIHEIGHADDRLKGYKRWGNSTCFLVNKRGIRFYGKCKLSSNAMKKIIHLSGYRKFVLNYHKQLKAVGISRSVWKRLRRDISNNVFFKFKLSSRVFWRRWRKTVAKIKRFFPRSYSMKDASENYTSFRTLYYLVGEKWRKRVGPASRKKLKQMNPFLFNHFEKERLEALKKSK